MINSFCCHYNALSIQMHAYINIYIAKRKVYFISILIRIRWFLLFLCLFESTTATTDYSTTHILKTVRRFDCLHIALHNSESTKWVFWPCQRKITKQTKCNTFSSTFPGWTSERTIQQKKLIEVVECEAQKKNKKKLNSNSKEKFVSFDCACKSQKEEKLQFICARINNKIAI